jgi:type II restriction enzyme
VRYLPYGELERHRASIARFGTDLRALTEISHRLI